jgi:uncharacterized protein
MTRSKKIKKESLASILKTTKEGVILLLKIIPKARQNKIIGPESGFLKIHLTAVPEKGKANAALIQFLAKSLGRPKNAFILIKGETSAHKQILIQDMTEHEFYEKIQSLLETPA